MKNFYIGIMDPGIASKFDRAFISVNQLRNRRTGFEANKWIMDSGGYTEIANHGEYRHSVKIYAREIRRWKSQGELEYAVAQDWMCAPPILNKTGLTIKRHQELTIERYDALLDCDTNGVEILPVLQGWHASDFVRHLEMYGDRLGKEAYVGVGSVVSRSAKPRVMVSILCAIKHARPDLQLHGFGIKLASFRQPTVRALLYSTDSMAWSYAARKGGRDQTDWREAKQYEKEVLRMIRRDRLRMDGRPD